MEEEASPQADAQAQIELIVPETFLGVIKIMHYIAKSEVGSYAVVAHGDTEGEARLAFARALHWQMFGCPIGSTSFHDYTDEEGFLDCCLNGFMDDDFRPTAAMLWDSLNDIVHNMTVTKSD